MEYAPFGTTKVVLIPITEGDVADLNARLKFGTVKECVVIPDPEGTFIANLLEQVGCENLACLCIYLQEPSNSTTIRAKISQMLFQEAPERYEFYFREALVMGNGAISVIVGNPRGMAAARENGLVPKNYPALNKA